MSDNIKENDETLQNLVAALRKHGMDDYVKGEEGPEVQDDGVIFYDEKGKPIKRFSTVV
jgi:hypothetical protein